MRKISGYILLFFLSYQLFGQVNSGRGDIRIMFYNTENLFDTADNPQTNDEEFLPESDMHWNSRRYWKKVNQLFQVIAAAGEASPPEIIGFCEVENSAPLRHLIKNTPLSKHNYTIIHNNSPDERGIDVALLVRNDKVKVISTQFLKIQFAANAQSKTREILFACLKVNTDTLFVFVNHWPSRRGGEQASEPKRLAASNVLKAKTDSILQKNKLAKIVIMGDFNDEPTDKSLKNLSAGQLVNLSVQLKISCKCGSYKYQSAWQMFDQVLVSQACLGKSGIVTSGKDLKIFQPSFLLVKDEKYGGVKPFRTYQGPKYLGGFSDHLPVILDMNFDISKN